MAVKGVRTSDVGDVTGNICSFAKLTPSQTCLRITLLIIKYRMGFDELITDDPLKEC